MDLLRLVTMAKKMTMKTSRRNSNRTSVSSCYYRQNSVLLVQSQSHFENVALVLVVVAATIAVAALVVVVMLHELFDDFRKDDSEMNSSR
jgi:hypothetical protein